MGQQTLGWSQGCPFERQKRQVWRRTRKKQMGANAEAKGGEN